jgi:hypothetical protein
MHGHDEKTAGLPRYWWGFFIDDRQAYGVSRAKSLLPEVLLFIRSRHQHRVRMTPMATESIGGSDHLDVDHAVGGNPPVLPLAVKRCGRRRVAAVGGGYLIGAVRQVSTADPALW